MTRDALWWEVLRRTARTPALRDRLDDYLLGMRPFADVALDALEATADPEPAPDDFAHDADAEAPLRTELDRALARYGQGEPAEAILLELFEETLGAQAVAGLPLTLLRAQCAALETGIAERQRALQRDEAALRADVLALEQARVRLVAARAEVLSPGGGPAPSSSVESGGTGGDRAGD